MVSAGFIIDDMVAAGDRSNKNRLLDRLRVIMVFKVINESINN